MTCEEHSIDLICAVSKLHIDRFVLVIHFCRNMRVGAGNIGSFSFPMIRLYLLELFTSRYFLERMFCFLFEQNFKHTFVLKRTHNKYKGFTLDFACNSDIINIVKTEAAFIQIQRFDSMLKKTPENTSIDEAIRTSEAEYNADRVLLDAKNELMKLRRKYFR